MDEERRGDLCAICGVVTINHSTICVECEGAFEAALLGEATTERPPGDLEQYCCRGIRKPLGVPGDLHLLVQFYNEVAEHKISPNAAVVHEALLHLNWLAEVAEAKAKNDFGGHGPEHYANISGRDFTANSCGPMTKSVTLGTGQRLNRSPASRRRVRRRLSLQLHRSPDRR
jgi:hypothetical protein